MLGDDVVGDQAAGVADIQPAWEMVVVWEFVEAVAESGPFVSEGGLRGEWLAVD